MKNKKSYYLISMKQLDWENCYNEFSRTTSRRARGLGFLFRMMSSESGFELKIVDQYTGDVIASIGFIAMHEAMNSAERINQLLGAGYDIKEIIKPV